MTATATASSTLKVRFLDLAALHQPLRADLETIWSQTLDNSAFIGGSAVGEFEQAWAAYCGTQHAIGVANGTDALELAIAGLGIGAGDEVVVPANTFVATAEAVVRCGATPVFADVRDDTLLIDAAQIEAVLTPQTKAVIVVHLYGQIPEMDPILDLCRDHDLLLIEDAAQAHGATYNGRIAGSFGNAATFSFYPGKNLGALGDAGAIVTNDERLAQAIRVEANHGRDHHLLHSVVGRNSRLDGVQAGALAIKLPHLDTWNAHRIGVHDQYRAALAGTKVQTLATAAGSQSVHHLEVVRVDDRDGVREALSSRGIDSGIHYALPCHEHPAFAPFARGHLPVAETAARRQLSLPMHPTLTSEEVDHVTSSLLEITSSE